MRKWFVAGLIFEFLLSDESCDQEIIWHIPRAGALWEWFSIHILCDAFSLLLFLYLDKGWNLMESCTWKERVSLVFFFINCWFRVMSFCISLFSYFFIELSSLIDSFRCLFSLFLFFFYFLREFPSFLVLTLWISFFPCLFIFVNIELGTGTKELCNMVPKNYVG